MEPTITRAEILDYIKTIARFAAVLIGMRYAGSADEIEMWAGIAVATASLMFGILDKRSRYPKRKKSF